MTKRLLRRNTAIFCGGMLLMGLAFGLCGWLRFAPDVVVYRIGKLGNYRVTYVTLAALAALALVIVAPRVWLGRVLGPLVRTPALAPGAILAIGAGCLAFSLWPLWTFFVGGAALAGSLFWLLRRETCRAADGVLAWGASARSLPVLVTLGTAVATFALNRVVYHGEPYVVDSCARYAHVLMLSHGYWSLPAPPDWQWTVSNSMINDGVRYCSQYEPGIILVGLLSHVLGSDALVPALMAAGVAGLTYLVGRRIYGTATAALGTVLLALSVNFLFLAASFMEHTPTTFFLMAALWLGLRDLERPRAANAWLLGFCVGFACIIRSVTALGWAAPLLAVWCVLRLRRWGRAGLWTWGVALAGWLVPMAFMLYFNGKTTGSGLVPGFWATNPYHHSLGFTKANGHTPLLGLVYQWNNVWSLSQWLFFWPATSYLFIVALFLLARWEKRDTLLMLPFAGLVAIYFFYTYQDFDFSPRFLSESIPLLALVTARGMIATTDYLRRSVPAPAPRVWRRTMLALVVVLFALAIPPAQQEFWTKQTDCDGGVATLERLLFPFHSMANATVFLDGDLYGHRALTDEVECWGGARFLEAPSREMREDYVRNHPERRCFFVVCNNRAYEMKPEPVVAGRPARIAYLKAFDAQDPERWDAWWRGVAKPKPQTILSSVSTPSAVR